MSRQQLAARACAAAESSRREAFSHEAFLYADHEQFLAATTAFVRGGLDAGQAVLVAVTEPRAGLLATALGADAERVEFLDMATVGRNPARIIPAWQDWVDRQTAAGRGCRGVGEPVWAGRSAAEIVECQQHEQLLNTAFDGGPGWRLLCPYDTAALPATVIDRARDTHPALLTDDRWEPSPTYPRAEFSFPAMLGAPLEEPAGPVREVAYDLAVLGELRHRVADFAEPVLGRRGAGNAVLVVDELAANSVIHGGGAGTLRMWCEGTTVVVEARDHGTIVDPLIGRRRPVATVPGRAGLWIVNQLCDLLQIRSDPERGTVIRARLGTS
ncbi:MAG: sensor histidine kinase [Catenulispora sp.]|nr:sensor histidine kinase [Catenulispora sp.]